MKNISKKIKYALYGLLTIAIVGCTALLVQYQLNRNVLNVSFYGLDDKTIAAIEQTIIETNTVKNSDVSFEFMQLDVSLPLEGQVGKSDILFTLAGKNADSIAQKSVGVPSVLYNNFPKSIASTGFYQNYAYAVPIVLNHFEISYNTFLLRNYNSGNPFRAFDHLIPFATYVQRSAPQTGYPFAIAGGDDTTLLLFLSALIESFYGKDGYMKFVEILNENQVQTEEDFLELVQKPLIESENKTTQSTVENLFEIVHTWKQWRYIHPEWMHLTEKDILDFIDLERPAMIFMPLSFHRTVPFNKIRHYTTSWFPAGQSSVSRSLVIPTVLGIPLTNKTVEDENDTAKAINAQSILAELTTTNIQGTLSDTAELAPAHSTAQALDKQASDLRLWAAASDSLLPSIKESAFVSIDEASMFCEFLRKWLDR